MKRTNLTLIFALLFAGMFIFNSCSENTEESDASGLELYADNSLDQAALLDEVLSNTSPDFKCAQPNEICGDYKVYPLIASQKYYAGALIVYNDNENLYVTYWGGWWIKYSEFHLYVGSKEGLPINNGKVPVPGNFSYKSSKPSWFKTFEIPLSSIPDCYIIAAHAVTNGHTIWAKDCLNPISFKNAFGSKRWGWIIEDCKEECEPQVEEELIFTLKTLATDTLMNEQHYFVLNNGNNTDAASGWCSIMNTVVPNDGDVYNLMTEISGNNYVVGNIYIQKTDSEISVTIERNAEGWIHLMLSKSYLFLGTQEEFDALTDGCPDYLSFPYTIENWSDTQTITIAY